jgi:hypothetical protein
MGRGQRSHAGAQRAVCAAQMQMGALVHVVAVRGNRERVREHWWSVEPADGRAQAAGGLQVHCRNVATRQVLTSLPPALLAGAEPGPSDALQLSAAGVAARVAVPLALANPPTLRCGALGALGEGGGLAQH